MPAFRPGRPNEVNPWNLSRSYVPHAPGWYRFVQKGTQTVERAGEASDLARRIGDHRREGTIPRDSYITYKIADGRSTSRTRRLTERRHIERYNPRLNRRAGGGGRHAR
jgi:hypothetical protein